jgi:hypothetical protein
MSEASITDAEIRAQHAAMLEMQDPLARTLLAVRDALRSLPEDALGEGESGGACWPTRNELLTGVEHCLKLQRELKERSDALVTQPQGREELRAKVLHLVGEASNTGWLAAAKDPSDIAANKSDAKDAEVTDAIMSLIPPAGLPVEVSDEAMDVFFKAFAYDGAVLRDALELAYAIDARPVKVKALEWEAHLQTPAPDGGNYDHWNAPTGFGEYNYFQVCERPDGSFSAAHISGSRNTWAEWAFKSEADAKAACQSHFDTLVS